MIELLFLKENYLLLIYLLVFNLIIIEILYYSNVLSVNAPE